MNELAEAKRVNKGLRFADQVVVAGDDARAPLVVVGLVVGVKL